jgi:flagellar basal body P-ring protein FlgI
LILFHKKIALEKLCFGSNNVSISTQENPTQRRSRTALASGKESSNEQDNTKGQREQRRTRIIRALVSHLK